MTSAFVTRASAPALSDKQVYRLLFAATFVIFLVSVVVKRLVRSLHVETAMPTKSIFAEAKETASSTLLFAFMG